MSLRRTFSILFGFREPVTRRVYLTAGLALFALKYAADFALSSAFATNALDPITYFDPLLSQRIQSLGSTPDWLPAVMFVWALPFIWIGVSMSARRALHGGLSPWLCLLFFVPVVNYLLIIALSVVPLAPTPGRDPATDVPWTNQQVAATALARLRWAAISVVAAAAFGSIAAIFSVFGAQQYGSALFIGAPFVLGVISGVLFNRSARQSAGATIAVASIGVTLAGGVLLLLALEGILCLAMTAVLAYPLAILGALFGRALALGRHTREPALTLIVSWPLLALMPWEESERFALRSTTTSVEIAAPPERVWPNVIGFPPLPPAENWLLRSGVACPLSARIEGEGVGAVRYCEFTTGAFVEPITSWEPPLRLAFDVIAQPPSMREWSPYEVVHAPHLHGGIESLRGEFLLTRIDRERTRLTGTTWYRLKITPQPYWNLYADRAIHAIHDRVLSHIRDLSELEVADARTDGDG